MTKAGKLILIFTVFFAFFLPVNAETQEFFGIGAELMQDVSNKKIIVIKVLNNTPAQKAGIKAGDEIIAIDRKRTGKKPLCEIISKIRGKENTKLTLRIKRSFFKRKIIELTREKITVNYYRHELFDSHWAQIATPCYREAKIIPQEAVRKFSGKHRKTVIALNEYWAKRKAVFQAGFNACVSYSNKESQENCLIHLLDRESAKTNADKAFYKFLRN